MVPELENLSFGGVIRDARKRHGRSLAEVDEKPGVSRPTIARIEAGNDVTTAAIAKVAQVLDINFELKRTDAQPVDSKRPADGDT